MMFFADTRRAMYLLEKEKGGTGERINAGLGVLTSALPKRVTKCHRKLVITFHLSAIVYKTQWKYN